MYMRKQSDEMSVYSTEIIAIVRALEWIEKTRPERVMVCSDSAAALSSMQLFKSCRVDLLLEVYSCLC